MIERKNDAFIYKFNKCKSGWEQWFLLISDIHFDSKQCDRNLLRKHLNEALNLNARIIVFGDWFDAMGGQLDRRTTKSDIRPEYNTKTYFDDIVIDSVKFLKPYRNNLDMFANGNHETSITMHHEIDILGGERGLCTYLDALHGGYNGFIRFNFEHNTGGHRSSKIMYYTHGGGGNAPVTKGAIKSARRQDYVLADFYVGAHIHTEYEIPRPQARLNDQCNVILHKPVHWQLGTYNNTFMDGGWADHKEFPPPNLGGRWLRFNYLNHKITHTSFLTTE